MEKELKATALKTIKRLEKTEPLLLTNLKYLEGILSRFPKHRRDELRPYFQEAIEDHMVFKLDKVYWNILLELSTILSRVI